MTLSCSKPFHNTLNYASTVNIEEVMKFYNIGDKSFETDFNYSSHTYMLGQTFCNNFFLNHNTIALVRNCLKLLSCVVIETALDGMKKNQLS